MRRIRAPWRSCAGSQWPAADAPELTAHQHDAQAHGGDLGDHRGDGDTDHPHSQPENEPEIENDVQAVHEDLQDQGGAGVLDAEEPAGQGIHAERRRGAPDADMEIVAGQVRHLAAGADDLQRRPQDGRLDDDGDEADGDAQDPGPGQPGPHLGRVAGAQRLGRQARGAHAQEIHDVIDEGEDQGADGDGADELRSGQVADHGDIDGAQERQGQVGEYHRAGQAPGLAVPVLGHRRRFPPGAMHWRAWDHATGLKP